MPSPTVPVVTVPVAPKVQVPPVKLPVNLPVNLPTPTPLPTINIKLPV